MPDKYRIRHNDKIIKLQLDDKIENMNDDFRKDLNKSYFSIVSSIFSNIKDYILNLGKPSFKKRKAEYSVNSDDYNQNNIEIVNDLRNAFTQANELKDLIKDNMNYSILFNDFLKNSLNKIEDYSENLNVYIENPFKSIVTINENFRDLDTLDMNQTTATIKKELGQVTLGIKEHINQMISADDGTKIEILNSSNGYEGNFQQAITGKNDENIFIQREVNGVPKDKRSWKGSGISYLYQATGNLRMNERTIIDGNKDTWFEYEICNVPQSAKSKTCHNELSDQGKKYRCTKNGWNWFYLIDGKEEIWAREPEKGTLKLDIRLTLPEARYSNYIDINSFIMPYDDYEQSFEDFEVREVKIAAHEKGQRVTIYHRDQNVDPSVVGQMADYEKSNKMSKSSKIFNFRPQDVKVVEFYLEQSKSYDCYIGHPYYWFDAKYKIETDFIGISLDKDYEEVHLRIPGPGPNRDDIKVEIDSGTAFKDLLTGGLIGAGIGIGIGAMAGLSSLGPIGWAAAILGAFLVDTEVSTVYEKATGPWLEAFKGWRYAIGIREVSLNSYVYEEEGVVITKNYEMPKQIKKVEVNITDDIPNAFFSNKTDDTSFKNRMNWIKYYFSIDNGSTWHRITDNKTHKDIPGIYYVNTDPIDIENNNRNIEFINSENNSKIIKFKAELSRPLDLDDSKYFTPVLDNISAKIEVVGEDDEIEY